MPTKIVSGNSDYLKGEINSEDLSTITGQFQNHISLSSSNSRPITKLGEISIPIEIMKNLIASIPASERNNCNIVVRFGVTLSNQLDCRDPHDPVGDHLTAVLFLENNETELLNEGDFIITTGFKEFVDQPETMEHTPAGLALMAHAVAEGACCPVIRPGG